MFDPYKKWLGISPKDQPPNHYRLLGLDLYESDLDVVEGAADRVMGFLRQYQSGENAADAAKLLNETATARICLLKPGTKAEYDAKLRKELDASKPDVVTKDDLDDFSLPLAVDLKSETPPEPRRPKRSARAKKVRRSSSPPWIPVGAGAVFVVLVVAVVLGSRAPKQGDRVAENSNTPPAANQSTSVSPASPAPQPSSVTPTQSNPPPTTQPSTKEVETDSAAASSTSEKKTEVAVVKIPAPSPVSPKESTPADQKGSPNKLWGASPPVDPSIIHSDYLIEDGKWGQGFCQGVSLAETSRGIVAAFWGGAADEGSPDRGIWVSHRGNDRKWSPPFEVASIKLDRQFGPQFDAPHAAARPVLFPDSPSRLDLYYGVGHGISKWRGVVKTSEDQGMTWSKPTLLPEGICGPIRPSPHRLPNKTILFGSETVNGDWKIHFEFFGGKKWSRTADVNDGQSIRVMAPTLLDHGNNRWQAIGRSSRDHHGKIFQTWSNDGGKTWSKITFLDLPNPSAPVDAIRLTDGRFLMVYNHSPTVRTPFNMALSEDGINWQAALVLESDDQETSHPSLLQTQDGLVHLAYPRAKKSLRYLIIDPQKLRLKPIVGGVWPTAE